MSSIAELIATPLMLILCIWSFRQAGIMTKIAAYLYWLQVIVVFTVLSPVLTEQTSTLILSPDFTINRLGALFAVLTQVVVASSMTHAHIFFKYDGAQAKDRQIQLRVFYTCVTLFLVAMTAVFFCNNLGFLWISVEGTTLCSAPLIYFHRNKHALEAAWKYLMICSVGIAFALFGTICIFASSQHGAISGGSLNLQDLQAHAKDLQYPLLRLGFLFCLLGYGTKAGIFPLHSWLPDAHSEAPAPASALLSGGLLNCALFAIWRTAELLVASGHQHFSENSVIPIGALTVLAASLFLIHQHALKRLFAYSSIENVGLMLTAIGLSSGPLFFLLALNHSIVKVALFLISGNIVQSTGKKSLNEINGLTIVNPFWAALLLIGGFAVSGAPPFGSFAAEWLLLTNSSQQHRWGIVATLLIALAVSFLAITMHIGKMFRGTPKEPFTLLPKYASSAIPAILISLALLCGITSVAKLFW